MELADAIDLLGSASLDGDGPTTWADLGCGDGTFTRALAARLAAGSTIHAMDRNRRALARVPAQADGVRITTHHGDFTTPPWPFASLVERIDGKPRNAQDLSMRVSGPFLRNGPLDSRTHGPLDGILMANSLHYVREQADFLRRCTAVLTSHGHFVIVEYDTDVANRWVPHPVSRAELAALFGQVGDMTIEMLGARPSIYNSAGFYAALVCT